jgi:predicted RNA-binding Zn ribbon-like protein
MLWDDFLNSMHHDWRGGGRSEDRLDRPGWLDKWLTDHQLTVSRPPLPEEMAAMKQLRTDLYRMVEKLVSGSRPGSEELHELNRVMAAGAVFRQIAPDGDGYRLDLTAAGQNWPQVMADIAASFAKSLAEGEPSRFRICDNPDCLWVYYDDTRNRSKRYCDDKMCGNLMKVRRFRARKKAAADKRQPLE